MQKTNITLKTLHNGNLVEVGLKVLENDKLSSLDLTTYKRGLVLDFEVGAHTSLFGDPTTSIMLHYHVLEHAPYNCVYRKEGDSTWIDIPLHADNPFPSSDKRIYWYKLEGLEPDTIYETKLVQHEQIHRFKTFPSTASDVSVAMISDTMNNQDDFKVDAPQGFSIMENHDADMIAFAGDFVHDNGWNEPAWSLFWDEYFKHERNHNLMIPFVACLGNHDGASYNQENQRELLWVYNAGSNKDAVTFAYNFFANLNEDAYGVIDISDYMSIVFLNSDHTVYIAGDQTTWLDSALNARQGRHIFPFYHAPTYGAWYRDYNPYIADARQHWTPLFSQYGVKVVGNGHDHLNCVTKKVTGDALDPNGVVYVIQHGMGNDTRGERLEDDWYVDYLDVENKAIDIFKFKTNGDVELDKVALQTGTPLYSVSL